MAPGGAGARGPRERAQRLGPREKSAARQVHHHGIGDVLLGEARQAGAGAVHIDAELRIVGGLLQPDIGGAWNGRDPREDTTDRIPVERGCGRYRCFAGSRTCQQCKMTEPECGEGHRHCEGQHIGKAEQCTQSQRSDDGTNHAGKPPPTEHDHHQWQRSEIEQQQRNGRARCGVGEQGLDVAGAGRTAARNQIKAQIAEDIFMA